MTTEACGYRFDPGEWNETHEGLSTVESRWSCERDPVGGTGRCEFHLEGEAREELGIDDSELRDSFLEELAGGGPTTFIGASFGDLDLSRSVVERPSNRAIDLRHADIDGALDLSKATVRQPLLLDRAAVDGHVDLSNADFSESARCNHASFRTDVDLENARFDDDVAFRGAEFGGEARFERTTFTRSADFYDATFEGDASFGNSEWLSDVRLARTEFAGSARFLSVQFRGQTDFRGASFRRTANFSRSTFGDEALFVRARFESAALFKKTSCRGPVYYQDVYFGSEASFAESTFRDKLKFRFAEFHGEASIAYVDFEGSTYFTEVAFHEYVAFFESSFGNIVDFRRAEFHDIGRFMKAEFGADAYFDEATFVNHADFRETAFETTARFDSTEFRRGVTMTRARFADLRLLDLNAPNGDLVIDLCGSEIGAGELRQRAAAHVYFDLRTASVGDVDVDVSGVENTFDRILFHRTDFEGFDFSKYHYTLAPKWELHRFGATPGGSYQLEAERFSFPDDDGELDPGEKGVVPETGVATAAGDGAAHDGLLRRFVDPAAPELETTYLKAKNGASDVGDSRAASKFFVQEMRYRRKAHLKQLFDPEAGALNRVRSGFLVVTNSFFSITCGYGEKPGRTLLFSGAVIAVYALAFVHAIDSPPFGTDLGYLLLSIQSFTTFILGSHPPNPDFLVRFLAATQGFVGAFLIGLFVFTLTRIIHR